MVTPRNLNEAWTLLCFGRLFAGSSPFLHRKRLVIRLSCSPGVLASFSGRNVHMLLCPWMCATVLPGCVWTSNVFFDIGGVDEDGEESDGEALGRDWERK